MAFFDPVDLSTESLLWPGRLGFCFVARAATTEPLLLRVLAGQKEQPDRGSWRQPRAR